MCCLRPIGEGSKLCFNLDLRVTGHCTCVCLHSQFDVDCLCIMQFYVHCLRIIQFEQHSREHVLPIRNVHKLSSSCQTAIATYLRISKIPHTIIRTSLSFLNSPPTSKTKWVSRATTVKYIIIYYNIYNVMQCDMISSP